MPPTWRGSIDAGPHRAYLPLRSDGGQIGAMLVKDYERPVIARLFSRRGREDAVPAIYLALVEQARRPGFYTACGVPDTVDGRFDLLVLHVFLVMHRLKAEGGTAAAFAQKLFDYMFADMDQSLREMGVGDLSVGKKVKHMARSFYGRVVAYEKGLEAPEAEPLEAALRRNLFGTVEPDADRLALISAYVRREAGALSRQPAERLLAGELTFGPPPDGPPPGGPPPGDDRG